MLNQMSKNCFLLSLVYEYTCVYMYTVFSPGTYLKTCWSSMPSFVCMHSQIVGNLYLVQIMQVPKTEAASNL